MNKMIKMATIVAGVGAMLSFAGCGNGPDKVAVKFMENFSDGNIESACKYTTKQTGMLLAMAKGMAENDDDMKKMKGAKFEAIETKVDGDSATVKMRISPKGGDPYESSDPVTLIKEDGDWKVNIKKDN